MWLLPKPSSRQYKKPTAIIQAFIVRRNQVKGEGKHQPSLLRIKAVIHGEVNVPVGSLLQRHSVAQIPPSIVLALKVKFYISGVTC